MASSVEIALWWEMKLPGMPKKPIPDPKFVLVYGGLYGQRHLCHSTIENVSGVWFPSSYSRAQTLLSAVMST